MDNISSTHMLVEHSHYKSTFINGSQFIFKSMLTHDKERWYEKFSILPYYRILFSLAWNYLHLGIALK